LIFKEGAGYSDKIAKRITKTFNEIAGYADRMNKTLFRVFKEGIGYADSFVIGILRNIKVGIIKSLYPVKATIRAVYPAGSIVLKWIKTKFTLKSKD
jgi:hypothetical protein